MAAVGPGFGRVGGGAAGGASGAAIRGWDALCRDFRPVGLPWLGNGARGGGMMRSGVRLTVRVELGDSGPGFGWNGGAGGMAGVAVVLLEKHR